MPDCGAAAKATSFPCSAPYPKDAAVTASPGGSASFSVRITTPGRPAEYTYQWYRNGAASSGATGAALTLTGLTAAATYSVYCKVTNKAGSVNSRTATLTVRPTCPRIPIAARRSSLTTAISTGG